MKKIILKILIGILLIGLCLFSLLYWLNFFTKYTGTNFQDYSRIYPEKVLSVDVASSTEQLQTILKDANDKNLKVSIAGSRHSGGGHTYYKDNVVIDMRGYNKVLSVDKEKKQIIVQSGAKWSDVQEVINPYGLAVKVMQSSNIFTVGGTLSANAHGRDLDKSSVVETVDSFRLLKEDGKVVDVSRTQNPELFKLVIGGYGLFGIILDVTLDVTENDILTQQSEIVELKNFKKYFFEKIKNNENVHMMLGRPSISENNFFDEIVVTTWNKTDRVLPEDKMELAKEQNVWRDKFFFSLSRKFDWAKDLRWYLQKKVELGVGEERVMSRNNAMRPPLAPLEFLEYYSDKDTDLIQEYYIPISQFETFAEDFKNTLRADKVNVISFTVRYVKQNNETHLPYCPNEDCFAVIFMANVGLDKDSQESIKSTTQKITEHAIAVGGTYYLTYQLYPTKEQLINMYPSWEDFVKLKNKYDPKYLFKNQFYENYK